MKLSDLNEHDVPQVVAAGIRRVVSTRYGSMLWTLAKLRKPKTCALCRDPIAAKTKAWSPITFGDWRMERICLHCWRVDDARRTETSGTRSDRARKRTASRDGEPR